MIKNDIDKRRRGAATALVIVCTVVLILLVFAAIQVSFMMNTTQVVRNALDAGTLNIADKAPEIKTELQGPLEEQYEDCLDSTKKVGLTNINRILSKALLECANAQEMSNIGQAGTSGASASGAYEGAKEIAERLADKIKDRNSLTRYLDALAPQAGSAYNSDTGTMQRLSGKADKKVVAPTFAVSYVHRGDGSNIEYSEIQIPKQSRVTIGEPQDGGERIPGYTSIQAKGYTFMMVPFRRGEMPHLISSEEFRANTLEAKPLDGSDFKVPNAFFASGAVNGSDTVAAANSIANPQRSYKLAIPHGYVILRFNKTQVEWKVNGQQVKSSTYDFNPEDQWEIKNYDVKCGQLNGYASVGNEYKDKSILNAIKALPGDHQQVLAKITQRVQEVDSEMTQAKLEGLLRSKQVRVGMREYIIYPFYESEDQTNPTIRVDAKDQVSAPWIQQFVGPDGSPKTAAQESSTDDPNTNRGQVIGMWKLDKHEVKMSGTLDWSPGTGANQCLGMLTVSRQASVTFDGHCPPP